MTTIVFIIITAILLCELLQRNKPHWAAGQRPRECPACGKKSGYLFKTKEFDILADPIEVLRCINPQCKVMIKNWQGHQNVYDMIDEEHQMMKIDLLAMRRREIEKRRANEEIKLKKAAQEKLDISKLYEKKMSEPIIKEETIHVPGAEPESKEPDVIYTSDFDRENSYEHLDESDIADRCLDSLSDQELAEIAEAVMGRPNEDQKN